MAKDGWSQLANSMQLSLEPLCYDVVDIVSYY